MSNYVRWGELGGVTGTIPAVSTLPVACKQEAEQLIWDVPSAKPSLLLLFVLRKHAKGERRGKTKAKMFSTVSALGQMYLSFNPTAPNATRLYNPSHWGKEKAEGPADAGLGSKYHYSCASLQILTLPRSLLV